MVFFGGQGGGVVFLHPPSATDFGISRELSHPGSSPWRGKGRWLSQLGQSLNFAAAFIKSHSQLSIRAAARPLRWRSVPQFCGVC